MEMEMWMGDWVKDVWATSFRYAYDTLHICRRIYYACQHTEKATWEEPDGHGCFVRGMWVGV